MVTKSAPILKLDKQIQTPLTESAELAQALMRSAGTGVYIIQEGNFVHVNSLFQELTGYTEEELLGTYSLDLVHPDDKERVRKQAIADLKMPRSPNSYEYRFIKKNGDIIWVLERVTYAEYRGKRSAVGSFMDITERKLAEETLRKAHDELEMRVKQRTGDLVKINEELQAEIAERKKSEDALQESQDNLRSILENAPCGVYLNDLKGTFLYGNKKAEKIIGYKRNELIGQSFLQFNLLSKAHLVKASKLLLLNMMGKPTGPDEFELLGKDGNRAVVEIATTTLKQKQKLVVTGFVRDITEQKRVEKELIKYREHLEELVKERTAQIETVNEQLQQKLVERKRMEQEIYDKNQQLVTQNDELSASNEELRDTKNKLRISNEELEAYNIQLQSALNELNKANAHRDGLLKSMIDGLCVFDLQGNVIDVNRSFLEMIDLKREEICGSPLIQVFSTMVEPTELEKISLLIKQLVAGTPVEPQEILATTKNGTEITLSLAPSVVMDAQNNPITLFATLRNITEQKQAEETVKRRLQFEETVARISSRLINFSDVDSTINATLADIGMLTQASRVYTFRLHENGATMDNTHEWCAEGVDSQISNLQNLPCDMFEWWMTKLNKGEVIHIKATSHMPAEAKAEKEILESRDIKSALILPLKIDGVLAGFIGCDNVIATGEWNDEDLAFLRVSSEVLGNALARYQSRQDLEQSLQGLQKSLDGTIAAIAIIVESRDPYTSGHQQRVTTLACTIAREMGLAENRIDGIRMAATIHDIGKISVPSEILSKPGKLGETEFELIKRHPQVGYDILKEVKFPCQVARIVLQHHERMDGSGYPAGLSGENILLEARILSVADVVEAIASHRPYRPALGIDEALAEISLNKEILYDPEVVDACLRLFADKGFVFE